ncbi:uncharacterized protein LOC142592583 isoform X1 [Dermacentor variabilis]|uniref:uncharacterized protein LOC142592583 isoform X1 n=1 Tax=Dermacentor variabilis TaxID=34621 RepID=UPI003F5C5412
MTRISVSNLFFGCVVVSHSLGLTCDRASTFLYASTADAKAHSCLMCHRSPEVLWHIPSHICNGKPFRVFQRQCLHLVTAAPSYRLRKPRGHGGKCRQPAHLEQPP